MGDPSRATVRTPPMVAFPAPCLSWVDRLQGRRCFALKIGRLQERERADRLTEEVAGLARQLAAAVQEAGARTELGLASEARSRDRARADAAAWKARPWWRRLRSGV